MMTTDEFSQLKEIIHTTVQEAAEASHTSIKESLEDHTNSDDHRFVSALRDRERRKQEMWEKIKGNLIFWFLVSTCSSIGLAAWNFVFKHKV